MEDSPARISKSLLLLPAELRHQILFESLPPTINICPGETSPLAELQRVCKQFSQDLEAISGRYTAAYIVKEPEHVRLLRQTSGINEIKHVVFHLFSSSELKELLDQSSTAMWTTPGADLLTRWMLNTHPSKCRLPKHGLKVIELDITPIPGYARGYSRAWIAWLVNHTSVSNRLWNSHEVYVADIITNLGRFMEITAQNQQPTLKVVGTISPKTRTRMPTVFQRIETFPRWGGLDAVFESDYLDDSANLKWETILEILHAEMLATQARELRADRKVVKDRLRAAFQDDKHYRSLFNKLAIREPEWTKQAVLNLAALATEGRGVSTPSLRYVRMEALNRAFLHQTAKHIDLKTFSDVSGGQAVAGIRDLVVFKNVHAWNLG